MSVSLWRMSVVFLQYQGSLEQELDGTIMLEEESLASGEENWVYKMMILCVCVWYVVCCW